MQFYDLELECSVLAASSGSRFTKIPSCIETEYLLWFHARNLCFGCLWRVRILNNQISLLKLNTIWPRAVIHPLPVVGAHLPTRVDTRLPGQTPDYQGRHLTTRVDTRLLGQTPDYQGRHQTTVVDTRLLGQKADYQDKHPTTRVAPDYQGCTRLLGQKPDYQGRI